MELIAENHLINKNQQHFKKMVINRLLAITIISTISLTVFSTVQSADILIYNSDTIYIETYPLETLMDADSLIRERIFGYSDEFCVSSGCWRGHVATWVIENDSLYLINLISGCGDYEFNLVEVFPDKKVNNNKVFADWFTGKIFEYQTWFAFYGNSNSEEKKEGFACNINTGIVSNIVFPFKALTSKEHDKLEIDTSIYVVVDTMPALITSGKVYELTELKHFILENIRYPQNGVDCMGSVFISFVVEKNGTISNKKFLRRVCGEYDEEAMKVVDLMSEWEPGINGGVPVRTRLTLPIKYRYD